MTKKELERVILRRRNALEKIGQRMAFRALRAQVPKSIDTLEGAISQMENISMAPIESFFKKYYRMAGKDIGSVYFAMVQKSDVENIFMDEMERYAIEVAGVRIVSITETTRRELIRATRQAIEEANVRGLGVEKAKNLILKYCKESIKVSRARAIAQTELITASNRASMAAAEKTGLTFKKYWSTSGLMNIRDSHLQAEFDSQDGISMDQPFSNGLMFPGDPSAPAEEVINCRCSVLHLPV